MEHLNRRQTLLNIAVASVVIPVAPAAAQTSGSPEGREIAPGVRRVDYSKRETMIPNYKTVSMRDNIYQPGASTSGASMGNDMVCHMLEGELTVDTGSGDTLPGRSLGELVSGAKGHDCRAMCAGPKGEVWAALTVADPKIGQRFHLVRYRPGDKAPIDRKLNMTATWTASRT